MKSIITNIVYLALNLQLFADVQTTLLDGLSAENKTYYDKRLIDEAGPMLLFDQFAQKRNIPPNGGKTVEFRKYSALPKAMTPLTEGVTPSGSDLTVTAITSTLQQYGNFIGISDVLDLTGIDKNVLEATKLLGAQMGLTMDTVTRNKVVAGTNVTYCPKTVDGAKVEVTMRKDLNITSVLTVDVVKRVVAKLKTQNAPKIDGYYIGIIHPNVAYSLQNDPAWREAYQYTKPENLYKGEIGEIAGVRFIESSEAKIVKEAMVMGDGGNGPYSIYLTMIFGANAYATTEVEGGGARMIIKQQGSGGTSDPLDQRATVGWKGFKTSEILSDTYLVRVESLVPEFPYAEVN